MNTFQHWLGIVKSVLASFLGVQSQANYVKDAEKPSFFPFIIVGVVMVVLLIVSVWLVVNLFIASH
jgi:hypothetical protein